MRPHTASRIAQAIQMFNLDGNNDYSIQQLADASAVSRKTLNRNKDLIECFDFALHKERYYQCDAMKLV